MERKVLVPIAVKPALAYVACGVVDSTVVAVIWIAVSAWIVVGQGRRLASIEGALQPLSH